MVSAKIDYTVPKHKRINKLCDTCGVRIYFIRNSSGKMVPFDFDTDKCHFETCLTPPNPDKQPYKPFQKPKISFRTIKNNTSLKEFIALHNKK